MDKYEEYLQSMTENLDKLYNRLLDPNETVSDKEVEDMVKAVDDQMMYDSKFTFGLHLYRARYAEGFRDDCNLSEYSYIPDAPKIRQLRYNLPGEQVLYTSSSPDYAFEEIRASDPSNHAKQFYLSVWRPDTSHDFTFQIIYDPGHAANGSTAESLTNIIRNKIPSNTSYEYFLMRIGLIMEIEKSDYRFSALLASKIFSRKECLISLSRKSGYSALNLTFNKEATDKYLNLDYVLLCDVPQSTSLFYNVHKVGKNINGRIVWFVPVIIPTTYQFIGYTPTQADSLKHQLLSKPNIIGPSSIAAIDEINRRLQIDSIKNGRGFTCEYELRSANF